MSLAGEETSCVECKNERRGDDPNFPGLGTICAWRKWFKDSGASDYWSKVDCIECELRCDYPNEPDEACECACHQRAKKDETP